MKQKLAKNFQKAYTFIFSALTAIVAFSIEFFAILPPETFGEYGLKATGIIAAIVAVLRVLPQPETE
jgi:hypothetical protein